MKAIVYAICGIILFVIGLVILSVSFFVFTKCIKLIKYSISSLRGVKNE